MFTSRIYSEVENKIYIVERNRIKSKYINKYKV